MAIGWQLRYNMRMKSLFQGKRKFISIPLIGILALAFFPIAIGLGLGYLIFKKVGNTKVRYTSLAVVGLLTLFIGSTWVAAMSSPSKPQDAKTAEVKQTAQVDYNESQATKPVKVSQSPTPFKSQTAPNNPNIVLAKVIKVVDGDTIEVDLGEGNKKTVRYIGIDTPETVDPRKPVQCFAKEASAKNKELVEGGIVGLEKDVSETDKYGRLLRYVYMGDLFINQVLVAEGYAYASSYPPDVKYQSKLKQSEQQARAANKGLWGACSTPSPTAKTNTVQPTTKATTQQNTTGGSTTTNNTYSGGDKDCKDFSTQAEAQAYFNSRGGSASNNVDRLDGSDHDGVVCESLP